MSRSLKKGPFIEFKLEKRITDMNDSGKKSVIKTWSRRSVISPDFVGHTIAVHNGNKFIPVYITENMVGDINWANLRPRGSSGDMEGKPGRIRIREIKHSDNGSQKKKQSK